MNPLPTFLPCLTTTRRDRVGPFLADLARSEVRTIALFPTTMKPDDRWALYTDLERIPGLKVPHVHLRSDCPDDEVAWLADRFGTEVFNVHPAASNTAYVAESPRWLKKIYLENADALPGAEQLAVFAGVCPDFSHWEAARRARDREYDGFDSLVRQFPPGCCHISAIREGDPNPWNGRTDHHHFVSLADFDYMTRYRDFLPPTWASLEVENPLAEQLTAIAHLHTLLD
jgi:hypothetical protein